MDPALTPRSASVVVQRTIIAVLLLGFVESVVVYQTGRVAPQLALFIFVPYCLLGLVFLGAAAVVSRVVRPDRLPRFLTGEMLSLLFLLCGPVLLFAVRNGGDETPAPLISNRWFHWSLTAAVVAADALYVVRRLVRHKAVLSNPAFFLCALISYFVATIGIILRTVDARGWTPLGWAHSILVVVAFIVGAAVLCLAVWRTDARAWRRLAAVAGVLIGLTTVVAVRKVPTLPLPVPQAAQPVTALHTPSIRGIVLVTLDTVRRDHVSLYGSSTETTPNLKRFAQQSIVFDNAYASAPYTLASHASLFTGRLPHEHGAHTDPTNVRRPRDFPLAGGVPTLAEELRQRGYRSAGIAANFAYLATWTRLSRGFDDYVATARQYLGYYPLVIPLWSRLQDKHRGPYLEPWPASAITDAAIHWLDENGSAPFFLFLNYLDAHEYWSDLPDSQSHALVDSNRSNGATLMAAYDKRIRFEDREVGRLLDWMTKNKLLDSCLIMVTSDHGEYFGEHGFWVHGHALHEPVLQIPLIVKFPGVREGGREAMRINHGQMFSLIENVVDGATPATALAAIARPEPRVIAEAWNSPRRRRNWPHQFGWAAARTVYDGPWKLIEKLGELSELYNLQQDPSESDDLFQTQPASARAIAERLTAKLPPLKGNLLARGAVGDVDTDLDERLKALGYTGP